MNTQHGGRVIVGVSPSMAGLEALRVAVAHARARGVPLRAVRAWQLSPSFAGAQLAQWSREVADQHTLILRGAFDLAMGGLPADVPVELVVAFGQTGPTLVDQVEQDDDLIVVGTPDRGRRWSTIGVTQYCRRHAGCPVLVVPPPRMARLGRPAGLARRTRREADRFLSSADSLPR
jgi:nucleotide-binding universal stress UspA family protein